MSEASMSTLPRTSLGATIAAAALAFLIAIGLLGGVAALFLNDGKPFEQAVIAEKACADSAFISERDACMRAFTAAANRRTVASR
jgi:hypothetical protein